MDRDINPFVYLAGFRVVVCKECKYAVVAGESTTHLRDKHEMAQADERAEVADAVMRLPGIIQDQAGLQAFQFPPPTAAANPFLAPPERDGLGCMKCRYVCRTVRRMQDHCRAEHGWINGWKRKSSKADRARQRKAVPWTSGVSCQRFFVTRVASGWFEVERAAEQATGRAGPATAESAIERVQRLHRERAARFEAAAKELVRVADEKKEPNPWLDRTGWALHLQGLDVDVLRETAGPIKEDEAELQRMWDSFERVLDRARVTAVPKRVGLAALFEAERKDVRVKPRKPFDNRLEDQTWAKYKAVWRAMLCICVRSQVMADEESPPYRFTIRQDELYGQFEAAAARDDEQATDRLCLDMAVGLLDHRLGDNHYDNFIISALAVLGIREDGGWEAAIDYTQKYSAVIKVARMLVLHQSLAEREDEVAGLKRTMSERAAREAATSTFRIVRGKVRRFMTLVSDREDAEPSPMDWILDTRSFGLRIRFTTPAEGSIDWRGDRIVYKRLHFGMGQLSDMLHSLLGEARAALAQLAMAAGDDLQALPRIAWARLEDDHSEERVGYSFASDDRNAWLGDGHGWVLRQIAGSAGRSGEWLSDAAEAVPYKSSAVRAYGRLVDQFREKMWMLVHMVAGQPARTTETVGVRMTNTANGGLRNIFAHNAMMCIVTSYHKNYRAKGDIKVIHRYLPRELGELLVWYVWLVLPFWQEVLGIVKEADRRSAFLWADEVVTRYEEPDRPRGDEGGGDEGGGGGDAPSVSDVPSDAGFEDWVRERRWTSDRLRRVIQSHSARLMGHQLNVAAWRHIAIAIANRYLDKEFGQADGDADEDEDGIDDDIRDLQAGHGTHVAGMVYARELQQGNFSTASRRDRYRSVSRRWHRLMGFGAEDRDARPGAKRRRDAFDDMREEARLRRFERLRRVDATGQLKQMMGAGAEFRGSQERVIRAIVQGESPIVQVAGTGEGKSLSFMLPAFCSPDGVTIVIVPLVSLRSDLHHRCAESGIESHVWNGRQANRAASVVFVTPESAVTKGFREFVNRLQGRQCLDRVVVDECHTVLDSTNEFRPHMQEVGQLLLELGVQAVLLTATLPPLDETAFFDSMSLQAARVRMFRARTTRRNIRYGVDVVGSDPRRQEKDEDAWVCRTVALWLQANPAGRVIVYASSVDRVRRLGEDLSCDVFYNKVDTNDGKEKRLRRWKEGGRLVVATNALGLGVDVPDVRLVVHAGMPAQLRDFVQESGRAGRDGGRSESVVVCGPVRAAGEGRRGGGARKGQRRELEAAAKEYATSTSCRRLVLDRVMDGWTERSGCEEGEEACDVCARQWAADAAAGAAQAAEADEPDGAFEQQQRRARSDRWAVERWTMQEREEVEEFRKQLDRWADGCIVCRLAGSPDAAHRPEDCPDRDGGLWTTVEEGARKLHQEMFEGRRFARYSGCFHCGFPQAMCERWDGADDDGGRFQLVQGRRCQYMDVMCAVYAGVYARFTDEADELMRALLRQNGQDADMARRGDEWYKWLGGLERWGGMQTNRMCRRLPALCRMAEDLMG